MEQYPLPLEGALLVQRTRREIANILRGDDDRLLVVVGPCSIHDATRHSNTRGVYRWSPTSLSTIFESSCVSFEKPRTTSVGRDSSTTRTSTAASPSMRDSIRHAACCWTCSHSDFGRLRFPRSHLAPIHSDAVTWAADGARTMESQVHRNLTSGPSMPVGFKNGTGGDIQMAVDAMNAASSSALVHERDRAGRRGHC